MKEEKRFISLIKKILCLGIMLVIISGVTVFAVKGNLKDVKIVLQNGCEITALTGKTKVSEILEENNVILKDDEKVTPDIEEDLPDGTNIKITKITEQESQIATISEQGTQNSIDELLQSYSPITEKIETKQEEIPFETITKTETEETEDTTNKVLQEGQNGVKETTYKVKYQKDQEIDRQLLSEQVIQEPINKIVQISKQVVATTTSRSSTSSRTDLSATETTTATRATTGTVSDYQSYAEVQCSAYGWSESDFISLVSLWNKESGWNPSSYNRSSGAYGIPQALPGSKMASAGSDYLTNYQTQIDWGLSYIKSKYGTPSVAWQHSKSTGWY